MKLFKRKQKNKRSMVMFTNSDGFNEWIRCGEYSSLDHNPEVVTACRELADLISSQTIYMMENTNSGDKRIKNALSRHVDITPNRFMTRKTLIEFAAMNMLLYGSGNAVIMPTTENGLLSDLVPIPANNVSFMSDGWHGYTVTINGQVFSPDELIHLVYNPDPLYPWKGMGTTIMLRDVVKNLDQAAATKKGFMSSKWKPSIIVKVDSMTEEFSSPTGRKKLLEEYVASGEAGEPWMIPAEQFAVEQIRPLSLSDLAINESVELDKKTVAAIIGVPPFVLGVGDFNKAAWDNFINTKIRTFAQIFEQEFTRKLLIRENWYFKWNVNSLYSYDLEKIAKVYSDLYTKGVVDGNEVRDKLNMTPRDGLSELVVLENYIPLDRIADQKKLREGEED